MLGLLINSRVMDVLLLQCVARYVSCMRRRFWLWHSSPSYDDNSNDVLYKQGFDALSNKTRERFEDFR